MMLVRIHTTIVLGLLLGACLLAAACGGSSEGSTSTPGVSLSAVTPSGDTTPRARKTATPSPTATATPLQVCAPNPDPAPATVLQLLEPAAGAQIQVPVHVRGWVSNLDPGKTISLAVVDEKQNVVQVNNLPPEPRDYRVAPPGLAVTDNTYPFAADIVLNNVTAPTPYCLWAYLSVDDQGHAKQVVQLPVMFLPRS